MEGARLHASGLIYLPARILRDTPRGGAVRGDAGRVARNNYWLLDSNAGHFAFLCPQRNGMVRAYVWHPREWDYRYQRQEELPRFVEDSAKAGVPREWYDRVHFAGPLAIFDGTDNRVEHPYQNGIALIGDAAATSDPSYGQGQSLTARDVRVLRDLLLSHDNWEEARHAYAAEHDRYYGETHKFTGWLYSLFYENSPAAGARPARAMPLLAQDLTRMPGVFVSGPDLLARRTRAPSILQRRLSSVAELSLRCRTHFGYRHD